MLCNPRLGQRVRIHYRTVLRGALPLHGSVGIVRVVGKGKPRKHGVEIDGQLFVVPCGNLQKVNDASD